MLGWRTYNARNLGLDHSRGSLYCAIPNTVAQYDPALHAGVLKRLRNTKVTRLQLCEAWNGGYDSSPEIGMYGTQVEGKVAEGEGHAGDDFIKSASPKRHSAILKARIPRTRSDEGLAGGT